MTREELQARVTACKARIEERRVEAETASTRIAELQAAAQDASDRLTAARERLSAITGNSLYKLLPSWVRELLDGLLG